MVEDTTNFIYVHENIENDAQNDDVPQMYAHDDVAHALPQVNGTHYGEESAWLIIRKSILYGILLIICGIGIIYVQTLNETNQVGDANQMDASMEIGAIGSFDLNPCWKPYNDALNEVKSAPKESLLHGEFIIKTFENTCKKGMNNKQKYIDLIQEEIEKQKKQLKICKNAYDKACDSIKNMEDKDMKKEIDHIVDIFYEACSKSTSPGAHYGPNIYWKFSLWTPIIDQCVNSFEESKDLIKDFTAPVVLYTIANCRSLKLYEKDTMKLNELMMSTNDDKIVPVHANFGGVDYVGEITSSTDFDMTINFHGKEQVKSKDVFEGIPVLKFVRKPISLNGNTIGVMDQWTNKLKNKDGIVIKFKDPLDLNNMKELKEGDYVTINCVADEWYPATVATVNSQQNEITFAFEEVKGGNDGWPTSVTIPPRCSTSPYTTVEMKKSFTMTYQQWHAHALTFDPPTPHQSN